MYHFCKSYLFAKKHESLKRSEYEKEEEDPVVSGKKKDD
jgi:hypothetical protein